MDREARCVARPEGRRVVDTAALAAQSDPERNPQFSRGWTGPPPARKFCTIDHWPTLTGTGRRATYEALARSDLRGVKVGTRTLIDCEAGLEWINSLPRAKIRPSRRTQTAA